MQICFNLLLVNLSVFIVSVFWVIESFCPLYNYLKFFCFLYVYSLVLLFTFKYIFYLELSLVEGGWYGFILIISRWLPPRYHLLNNAPFPHSFEMPLFSYTTFPCINFLYQLLAVLRLLLILIFYWRAEYALPGLCSWWSKWSKFIYLVSHCIRVPAGDKLSDKKMHDKAYESLRIHFFLF